MTSTVLHIMMLIDASVLIVVVLMQSGRAAGFSSAVSGGNAKLNLFSSTKSRGSDKTLEIITTVAVALFFILTAAIKYIV